MLTNSLDPDQMLKNMGSDQGLHCLPLIHSFSEALLGVGGGVPVHLFP